MSIGKSQIPNKDKLIQIRTDNETLQKLDTICKIKDDNRSNVIRKEICKEFDNLKK